jgi:RHS repeat-associated protein
MMEKRNASGADWPWPLPSALPHGRRWILVACLLAATAAAAQQVQDSLQYDARGNIIQRTIGEWPIGYRYDGLDRLREETAPGKQRLVLDADGNRLADGRSIYRVMPGGQRLADRDGIALAHGPAGHLMADRAWLDGRWVQRSFEWTLTGQIKAVRIDGKTVATYHYNDARQRTRKTLVAPPGGVPAITLYRYDPAGHLTLEVAGSAAQASGYSVAPGQVLVRYIWQDDEPVAVVWPARTPGNPDQIGDRTVYLHVDHLNTPRRATDARGVVVWQWISDAFGSSLPDDDPDQDGQRTPINLRFPGQYFDAESGLHYNWHRYYDPQVGRYTQTDPIGLAGGINAYAYVGGNPISYVDPTGEFLVGAGVGAGLELGIQAISNYRNGCDLLDAGNYNWGQVGVAAAVGAIAPGWLAVGKTSAASGKAIANLTEQLGRAQTSNRVAKIESRIAGHVMGIADVLIPQLGFQGVKAVASHVAGAQGSDCTCKK